MTYLNFCCITYTNPFTVELSGFVMLANLPVIQLFIDCVFTSQSKKITGFYLLMSYKLLSFKTPRCNQTLLLKNLTNCLPCAVSQFFEEQYPKLFFVFVHYDLLASICPTPIFDETEYQLVASLENTAAVWLLLLVLNYTFTCIESLNTVYGHFHASTNVILPFEPINIKPRWCSDLYLVLYSWQDHPVGMPAKQVKLLRLHFREITEHNRSWPQSKDYFST